MACSVAAAAQPRRIVSMNMCADQLLIELADRGQIAALTELSRDPVLSFHADRAQSYPVADSSAEEVLMLRPDLVVSPPFQRQEALSLLNGRSVKIVTVGFADSLEARSEEHTSELPSLMRTSYAVFCLTPQPQISHTH